MFSMPDQLPPSQAAVLRFLEDLDAAGKPAPTIREICAKFGYRSTKAAADHLVALEEKGYIIRHPRRSRGIELVRRRQGVPLLGRIAAGIPREGEAGAVEDYLPIDVRNFGIKDPAQAFALRVRGDSMIEAGIFDGDIAVLKARPDAQNGEIAAVLIDEEATLKRVYHSAEGLRLHAENPAYRDIVVRREDFKTLRIAGVLVGTLRKF